MSAVTERFSMGGRFRLECFAPDAEIRRLQAAGRRAALDAYLDTLLPQWVREQHNLVTEAGRTYLTGAGLLGAAALAAWYVGLTDGTPTVAAGDTMAAHPGWSEVTAYSEATRPVWSGVAGGTPGSATNSAARAVFTANAGATIGGLFLSSDSTKGGAAGTLLCVSALAGGDQPVVLNNVLRATYAWSGVDDNV